MKSIYHKVKYMSMLRLSQKGFLKLTKSTLISYLIVFLVFSGTGLVYLFNPFGTKQAEAVWFDDNFAYRKAITVTVTTNASDISNLQTLLTVDTTGITDKLQTNCEDLRFTNTNGKLLPYYIDTCSDNSATNEPSMTRLSLRDEAKPLSYGNKIWVMAEYMYYGNPDRMKIKDT